jgi:hypothetical protein
MVREEERAFRSFLLLKAELQSSSPHGWKPEFMSFIDKFIDKKIEEAKALISPPHGNEQQREEKYMRLHSIRRVVAGAFQEWELVQQPECASRYAELDGALVWDGRG